MLLISVNLVVLFKTSIYYGKVWNRKLLFLINSTYMCFTKNLFFFNKWLSLVWQGDNDTVIHRDTGHGHGVILGLMLTDWMLLSIIVVKQTPTIVETPTQAHITHWPSLSFILTFHRIALNIYLILRWSCDSILYILLELETIFCESSELRIIKNWIEVIIKHWWFNIVSGCHEFTLHIFCSNFLILILLCVVTRVGLCRWPRNMCSRKLSQYLPNTGLYYSNSKDDSFALYTKNQYGLYVLA